MTVGTSDITLSVLHGRWFWNIASSFVGLNGRGNKLKNPTKMPEHNRYWLLTKNLQ